MKSSDLKSSPKPKKIQLWRKAIIHFSLCFVTGFFTGFAPATTSSLFSDPKILTYTPQSNPLDLRQVDEEEDDDYSPSSTVNRILMSEIPTPKIDIGKGSEKTKNQLIIVTTTISGEKMQSAVLTRMAQTIRSVPSPVLWIVVERQSEAERTAMNLRRSGVMYRHLTYKESFSDVGAESEHQRNVALGHVEFHRLTGIVHFASPYNVYELEFFREIRRIDVFGVWPVAMVSANRKRVIVDGPLCRSLKVLGWFLKDMSNDFTNSMTIKSSEMTNKPSTINISGFAFNSSILWDPERWGRSTALPDTSQDSFKFVQDVILEDETKLKCIPGNSSKIMLWNMYIPRAIPLPLYKGNITNHR